MAAVPGIRPPKLSPFWGGFYKFSFCSGGGGAGGSGMVGGLITWHNWRSILLVAVVFGIRLPKNSIFVCVWGDRVGKGKILFTCISIGMYHYVFQCQTVILIFALSV